MQHHSRPLLFPHLKSLPPFAIPQPRKLPWFISSMRYKNVYFLFWFCQFCEKSINLLEFLEEPTLVFLNFLHWFFLASPLNSGLQLFFFPPAYWFERICIFLWECYKFHSGNWLACSFKIWCALFCFCSVYSVFCGFPETSSFTHWLCAV